MTHPLKISVCVNMLRPGGWDVLIPTLLRQTFQSYELIVVDELHRWRAPRIAERLKALPFPVKHLPTRDSLFPVSSTMRAGNTALAAAEGKLVVHLPDHAITSPGFLQEHWDRFLATGGKAFLISPYMMREVRPEFWAYPPAEMWEAIEHMIRGDRPDWDWTLLRTDAPREDAEKLCLPTMPTACSPGYRLLPGTKLNEWYAHYRCDSVPLDAYRRVNGWDEEYDGGYIYGDVDMSLRLMGLGLSPIAAREVVHVLDVHSPVRRPKQSSYRSWAMRAVLEQNRAKAARGAVVVDRGIVPTPIVAEQMAALTQGFSWLSEPVKGEAEAGLPLISVLQRAWAPGGIVHVCVPAEETFQWTYLEPDVLVVTAEGWDLGGFARVLSDQVRFARLGELGSVGAGATTVILGLRGVEEASLMDTTLDKAQLLARKRLIITGTADQINEVESWTKRRQLEEILIYDSDEVLPANGILVLTSGRFRRAE